MEGSGWICDACTFNNGASVNACTVCGNLRAGMRQPSPVQPHSRNNGARANGIQEGGSRFYVPGLLAGALSGALTGMFALGSSTRRNC